MTIREYNTVGQQSAMYVRSMDSRSQGPGSSSQFYSYWLYDFKVVLKKSISFPSFVEDGNHTYLIGFH